MAKVKKEKKAKQDKKEPENTKAQVMDVGELLGEEGNASSSKPKVTDLQTFEEIENKKGNFKALYDYTLELGKRLKEKYT